MGNSMLSIPQLASDSNESVAVWRKRIQRRQIAFVKLGRNVRVRREDYLSFISARLVSSCETKSDSTISARRQGGQGRPSAAPRTVDNG
jgi:hypothetical protein